VDISEGFHPYDFVGDSCVGRSGDVPNYGVVDVEDRRLGSSILLTSRIL